MKKILSIVICVLFIFIMPVYAGLSDFGEENESSLAGTTVGEDTPVQLYRDKYTDEKYVIKGITTKYAEPDAKYKWHANRYFLWVGSGEVELTFSREKGDLNEIVQNDRAIEISLDFIEEKVKELDKEKKDEEIYDDYIQQITGKDCKFELHTEIYFTRYGEYVTSIDTRNKNIAEIIDADNKRLINENLPSIDGTRIDELYSSASYKSWESRFGELDIEVDGIIALTNPLSPIKIEYGESFDFTFDAINTFDPSDTTVEDKIKHYQDGTLYKSVYFLDKDKNNVLSRKTYDEEHYNLFAGETKHEKISVESVTDQRVKFIRVAAQLKDRPAARVVKDIELIQHGDLILDKFVHPNGIRLGRQYSYSYTAENTFFDSFDDLRLWAVVAPLDAEGNRIEGLEQRDDMDGRDGREFYRLDGHSIKNEGDTFTITDNRAVSVLIKAYMGHIPDEDTYTNNFVEVILPVVSDDLYPNNLKIYNQNESIINELEYGQDIHFTFDVNSTFEAQLPNHKIEYYVSKLYADKTEKGKIINTTPKFVNILPESVQKFPNDFGLSDVSFTIPNESDVKYIKIWGKIAEHINESDKANNELQGFAGGSGIIIPIKQQNLIAKDYVGDTNITTSKSPIKVGANVTAINLSKGYDNVEFEVTLKNKDTKALIGTYTFNRTINGNGNANYTDETKVPNPGEGVYEVTVTVNTNDVVPGDDKTDNTTLPATLLITPDTSGNNGGGGGGGSSDINLQLVSYEGPTTVSTLQDEFQVKAKINNEENYTIYGVNVIKTFDGVNYDPVKISLEPGEKVYNIGVVKVPNIVLTSGTSTTRQLTIEVNPVPRNPIEERYDDNILNRPVDITITEPNLPPLPEIKTFDMSLDINGEGNNAMVKSGYAIPIEIKIDNFTHVLPADNPDDAECKQHPGGSVPYSDTAVQALPQFFNFEIQGDSVAKIIAKNFTFSLTPGGEQVTEAELNVDDSFGGEEILFSQTIYSDPTLDNGDYEILVDIQCKADWVERVQWWNPHTHYEYDCNHVRNTTCPNCGGDGQIRCSRCGGDGDIRCSTCGGDGEKSDGSSCSSCGGDGEKRCSSCGGDGERRCSTCSGTGMIHTCTRPSCNSSSHCNDYPNDEHSTNTCYYWRGDWVVKDIDRDITNYDFQEEFFNQQLEGSITINGSMYDDDSVIISD